MFFPPRTYEPAHKETKIIPVIEIIDSTLKVDAKKLLATGLDGIDYLLEVQKPLPIPFITDSRRKVTPFDRNDETDDKVPEPNSIKLIIMLITIVAQYFMSNCKVPLSEVTILANFLGFGN